MARREFVPFKCEECGGGHSPRPPAGSAAPAAAFSVDGEGNRLQETPVFAVLDRTVQL